MQAEIIAIGDELLIGQTINTNAAWIGKELSLLGIPVKKCTVISDDENEIMQSVDTSLSNSQIVIMTGGLGPTKDDITKHTLCTYFQTHLEIDEVVLARVTKYFEERGREMLEVNIQQAALPVNCMVLENLHGTASGMWFEKNGSVLISLPGVPYEMKAIMENQVFSRLQQKFHLSAIYHQTILFQGIGESYLADKISELENNIRSAGLGLAYLPSTASLKLRITSSNGVQDKSQIEQYFTELEHRFPKLIYGRGEVSLSEVVGQLLREQKKTIGTVESCTGGALASSLVAIPGSSDYFQGSMLTYSNALKIQLLNVTEEAIKEHGAVSEEVVKQMALNGRLKLGVDVCVSTSGIAGPDGGTENKKVGLVWIGISTAKETIAIPFQFGNHRERNIQSAVLSALNRVRCNLLELE